MTGSKHVDACILNAATRYKHAALSAIRERSIRSDKRRCRWQTWRDIPRYRRRGVNLMTRVDPSLSLHTHYALMEFSFQHYNVQTLFFISPSNALNLIIARFNFFKILHSVIAPSRLLLAAPCQWAESESYIATAACSTRL